MVRVVNTFPHAVREIEHCWIPMSDGCRLAARIWLPETEDPVPAIVEYIPYRKRDGTRWRDEPMHRYFAGHGYAAVRIDLRGSGESEGLLMDEYLEQEQTDGVEAIDWIASQAWCSGAVGMMGKSWGGFNSLQVAARRPAALKAIITVCSTDDRYADDAHYMGGCLLNENLVWGSVLFTLNALPPDPELVGGRWREMWLERLEHSVLYPEIWLNHQRRDDYWRHGSVCEDFKQIACPVYAVGGWADGYTNAVPRLLAGLSVPRKGLVGPWAHVYPHEGVPGPAIGFLQEALRWWDRWLKGIETGIMDEPMYRVWMQDSVPPQSYYEERPGRWVAEAAWPSPRLHMERYSLNWRRLEREPAPEAPLEVRSPQSIGLAAGAWCGFGVDGEMPADQREDDGKSLTFDSEPLAETCEILGAPQLQLDLAVDRPLALLVARLNDVAPNGASSRVTYTLLNLTHRNGHERPEPVPVGERFTVRMQLGDVAYAFPPGHRIRLALATSYWPVAWPSPAPATVTVYAGASWLELPVRPPHPDDARLPSFPPPEAAPPPESTDLQAARVCRTIARDLATGETVYTAELDTDDAGDAALSRVEPINLEVGHAVIECFRITEDDALSARAEVVHKAASQRGTWSTRVETKTNLSATATSFRLEASLEAYESGGLVFSRRWQRSVRRDLV